LSGPLDSTTRPFRCRTPRLRDRLARQCEYWPGTGHHGVSLPPGHEQVEQDRTPSLLAHRDELARDAARESRRYCQPDCLDAQSLGPPCPIGNRSATLSRRRDRDRRPDRDRPPRTTRVSWRLELYDLPCFKASSLVSHFLTGPKTPRPRPTSCRVWTLVRHPWAAPWPYPE